MLDGVWDREFSDVTQNERMESTWSLRGTGNGVCATSEDAEGFAGEECRAY